MNVGTHRIHTGGHIETFVPACSKFSEKPLPKRDTSFRALWIRISDLGFRFQSLAFEVLRFVLKGGVAT